MTTGTTTPQIPATVPEPAALPEAAAPAQAESAAAVPAAAPGPAPLHVLVVSVIGQRRQGVLADVRYILSTGSKVTMMAMRSTDWPELEGQVEFAEVVNAEARHPLPRTERALVFKTPNRVFRTVIVLCGRAAKVPGGTRPARVVVKGTQTAQQGYGKVSGAFHNRVFMKGYRAIRPWVLWRATRSTLLPTMDLDGVDLVLLSDAQAVSIGWHLAKLRPDLPVVFSLDRSLLPPPAVA